MVNLNEIIIRKGTNYDYKEIVKSGYPFDYKFMFLHGMHLRKLLFGKEIKNYVAYSLLKKKAVGFVYLQKINKNMWGIWGIYVSSDFRRRGIASKLYSKCFDFLKDENIKKCIGAVSYLNIPSLENLKKIWDGFVNNYVYKLKIRQYPESKIEISYDEVKGNILNTWMYNMFTEQVNDDWIRYLEIDDANYLKRVHGSAACEEYSTGLLRKALLPNIINSIAYNSRNIGYCVYSKPSILLSKFVDTGFFTLPHVFTLDLESLIHCLYFLKENNKDMFTWIGNITEEEKIYDIGLNIIDKTLICYKNL